ncbi:MAG: DUF3084 domain-containing protein [Fimbriimonas sp.]|nr:DUF3084 domain-containing protein [Fimbriimonas sp.]
MVQIGLLMLLVVMSGVIAVQADKVGKMLGKKRLSIFGLRPRHTATLGTVLVGIVISTFTITAVMVASSGVREWVLKGPRLLHEANQRLLELQAQTYKASQKNKELTNKNTQIRMDLNAKQAALVKTQALLAERQTKINTLTPRINDLSGKVATGNDRIRQLKAAAEILKHAKAQGEIALEKVTIRVKQERDRYSKLIGDSHDVYQKNLQLYNKTEDLQREQTRLKGELDRLNHEIVQIQADTKQAVAARDAAQLELKTTQTALDESKKKLVALQDELASVEKQLNDSDQAVGRWYEINKISRRQPMIYRFGEEVARLPVRPGLGAGAARNELTTLIRMARVEAQRRGARATARFPVAGIFDHTDQGSGDTITTQSIERQVEAQISGSKNELVIVASSSLNAFQGEPVSLEITVMQNPLVYAQGQIIVESVIDANRGDATISEQFSKFLQQTVRERALKDGMIPVANSDVPLGQVNLPQILQVTEQLRRADRRVRLAAVAAATTHAGDPLKLEFQLK